MLDAQGQIYLLVNGSRNAYSADGKMVWQYGTPCLLDSSPAASANGLVYFATAWGDLAAFNDQGRIVWVLTGINPDGGVIPKGSPVIGGDGMIYLDDGRFLYCFAATNGAPAANSSWPVFRANPQHTGRAQAVK